VFIIKIIFRRPTKEKHQGIHNAAKAVVAM